MMSQALESCHFEIFFVIIKSTSVFDILFFAEQMMLAIVRYVRHLDTTVMTLHIKTKLCQLVDTMMKRRDDLSFRQEMKFRNKLVEYLTDWVMGKSITNIYFGLFLPFSLSPRANPSPLFINKTFDLT